MEGEDKLVVKPGLAIPLAEIVMDAIRAQGPGGQNVNKVSSAIHLRFDVAASSLPEAVKAQLLALGDQRISSAGVVVIKAGDSRSREANRQEALRRLAELVAMAAHVPKRRRPTKPTLGSQRRRLEGKRQRGEIKAGRGKLRE